MRAATARNSRKPPMVGCRLAGFQHDYAQFGIYSRTSPSAFGELGDALWYPLHGDRRSEQPGGWSVTVHACGYAVYLKAVMDDFDDLVAVGKPL